MTTPTPNASFKIVTTQYWPDTKTTETITTTTETSGLLSGRKAEKLNDAIRSYACIQKALCYAIIPTTIIGIAFLIAAIFVCSLRGCSEPSLNAALCAPAAVGLGIAGGLGMIYCRRREEPVTITSEVITV